MRSRTLTLLFLLLMTSPAVAGAAPVTGPEIVTVPEMERPDGILYQTAEERRAFAADADAERGLERFETHVRSVWPRIREVDLHGLSRYQVAATEGFRLPAEPGSFEGQAIAWDEEAGRWHLELRGPRLPTRYDIVYRYLHLYTTFDPVSGELGDLVVTIRGWVLE